jgi:phage terminase large subunit
VSYAPRPEFREYHARDKRWSCIVAHRRAGKTVATVFDLLTCALGTSKRNARYAYIAPFYSQAKATAWDYLKRYSEPLNAKILESELSIELENGNRVRLYGADNPDALRGQYFDGVVLDEYGDQRPTIWGEIIRPLLADRQGWATFIGTPKGRNHFYDIREQARTNHDWLFVELRASETSILPAAELADARKSMTDAQYSQEFECAFDVPALGAIYAKEYQAARESKRICRVPYDPLLPVSTHWDIGIGDNTAIWFAQRHTAEIRVIDYYEANSQPLDHYVGVLKSKPYLYGDDWLPHDAQARELTSGKSALEILRALGRKVSITPKLGIEDGINAARMVFPRCYFDEAATTRGLECLQNYRRERNEKLGEFRSTPVHDWCFAANTLVLTVSGWRKIESVSVHDHVLTPLGKREIIRSGIVRMADQWITTCGIRSTPEHRFFTNRGLVSAGNLTTLDKFWTRGSWGLRTLGFTCAALRFGFMDAITSATHGANKAKSGPSSCIAWCMRLFMVRFRRAMKSITLMMTRSTIAHQTLKPSLGMSTVASTSPSHVSGAYAGSAAQRLAAIRRSAQGAAPSADVQIAPESSASVEPAYSLTVDRDECYFVRGDDGLAYLVANSSHGADAFRYLAVSIDKTGARKELAPIRYDNRGIV